MKRLFVLLCFLILLAVPAHGEEDVYNDDFRYSVTPEDSLLSDTTDLQDSGSVMEDLKFEHIFSHLMNWISTGLKGGLKTLTTGIALVLLSVIVSRCGGNIQNQNLQMLFSFTVSLSIALMCESSLQTSANALREAIENMKVFTTACIPSFSVVMIAAGEGASATVFAGAMVLLGELGTLIAESLLLPITDVYLAIGICSAVSDEYNFAAIGKNIRRFVIWAIGLLAVGFRLILKLQTSAAAAGDQVTKKYIKSAVGSLIPMVGNTLSEGVEGLFTVASGVKTSFAVAGVLIILSIMLPVLISIGIHGLSWGFCRWIADFMNDTTVRSIADVLANSFYLMLALGGSVALMGLFSFFGIMVQVQ